MPRTRCIILRYPLDRCDLYVDDREELNCGDVVVRAAGMHAITSCGCVVRDLRAWRYVGRAVAAAGVLGLGSV